MGCCNKEKSGADKERKSIPWFRLCVAVLVVLVVLNWQR